jgi:hypothetical protein
MKKDNTLLWVGVGSVLVVGVVLFFVLRNPNKKGNNKNAIDDKLEPEIDPTGKIQYGDVKIDPSKFKIDLDKVMNILKAPVTKEQKYANMKASGFSDNIINMVKTQDDIAARENMAKIGARIMQNERDKEFEAKFGVKPIKLPSYGGGLTYGIK